MREARRVLVGIFWGSATVFLIYKSPEIYARTCPGDFSFTSNNDLSKRLTTWVIESRGLTGTVKTAQRDDGYEIIQDGEPIYLVEIDKFSLWNPLKPDHPNRMYGYFGGNVFVIFDRCGEVVAALS